MKSLCLVILFLAALNAFSTYLSFREANWPVFVWASLTEIILLLTAWAFYRHPL